MQQSTRMGAMPSASCIPSKQSEAAIAILHNDALPFYQDHSLKIEAIINDNGQEFCGKDTHPYDIYSDFNDIQHRTTQVSRPQTNGFVERFNRTVLDEFFRIAFRTKFYESVDVLQDGLDAWLVHYNTERPHQGYRNMDRLQLARSTNFRLLVYGMIPKSTSFIRKDQ